MEFQKCHICKLRDRESSGHVLYGQCCHENCRLLNTTLAFEYSTADVETAGRIESVKNPSAGVIRAGEIGELILNEKEIDPAKTTIITVD